MKHLRKNYYEYYEFLEKQLEIRSFNKIELSDTVSWHYMLDDMMLFNNDWVLMPYTLDETKQYCKSGIGYCKSKDIVVLFNFDNHYIQFSSEYPVLKFITQTNVKLVYT